MKMGYRHSISFRREYDAYTYLRRSDTFPHIKLPQYFGHFELSNSLISTFYFHPSDYDCRHRISPPEPYKRAFGIEIFNGVGFDTISKDDLEDELMIKFESDLSQTVRALHNAGVCHRDIKANNILVDPRILKDSKQIEREYILIDLSAAVLKYKVSEKTWKRSQKHDLTCTRMIFEEIKAQKALILGFELICKILLSKSNRDMIKLPIDTEIQTELVALFNTAKYPLKASFFIEIIYNKLVDIILQVTDHLIPELCFIVVECLRHRIQGQQALPLLDKTLSQSQQNLYPEFNHHKALIMIEQSVDSAIIAQIFELAIAGYIQKYGSYHLRTLETRMEYVNCLTNIQNYNKAKEVIEDILSLLKSPDIKRGYQITQLESDCSDCIQKIDFELAKSQHPLMNSPKKEIV